MKNPETYPGIKTASSTNGADQPEWLYVEEYKYINTYHCIQNWSLSRLRILCKARYSQSDRRESGECTWSHWHRGHVLSRTPLTEPLRSTINGILWTWEASVWQGTAACRQNNRLHNKEFLSTVDPIEG